MIRYTYNVGICETYKRVLYLSFSVIYDSQTLIIYIIS